MFSQLIPPKTHRCSDRVKVITLDHQTEDQIQQVLSPEPHTPNLEPQAINRFLVQNRISRPLKQNRPGLLNPNPAGDRGAGRATEGAVYYLKNATVRGRVWYKLLDAPVPTLDLTVWGDRSWRAGDRGEGRANEKSPYHVALLGR